MPFWRGETLLNRLPTLIEPFDETQIDCAAYTLAVGPEAYVSPAEQESTSQKVVQLAERESLVIPPGQFAFLLTEETVRMPTNAIGFISMKATIKFRGLINVSGFHVDPGFVGRLVFAVFNAGPVPVLLRRGDACFLIWFADLDGESEMVKAASPIVGLSSAHVNGISGAQLHSIESLAKKINDVEKAHDDELHSIKREMALYKVVAGLLLAVIASNLKDCWTKHDPAGAAQSNVSADLGAVKTTRVPVPANDLSIPTPGAAVGVPSGSPSSKKP